MKPADLLLGFGMPARARRSLNPLCSWTLVLGQHIDQGWKCVKAQWRLHSSVIMRAALNAFRLSVAMRLVKDAWAMLWVKETFRISTQVHVCGLNRAACLSNRMLELMKLRSCLIDDLSSSDFDRYSALLLPSTRARLMKFPWSSFMNVRFVKVLQPLSRE